MEAKRRYRSKNPDLLFDDVIEERTLRVVNLAVCYKEGDLPAELDRVTILVTHRCNYQCRYCNGPHITSNNLLQKRKRKMLGKDLSFKEFKLMIKDWKKHRLKHIHFTGGEPTLNKNLPKMIRLATKCNILSSLTTNGSANISFYRKLVDNGLTEIRISIEASNSKDYDKIVGVEGYFDTVIRNISEITRIRDREKKDVFLVLNACVGTINLKKIKEILKFLISLNPDDIKFLVIAMEKKKIVKQRSKKVIKELEELLRPFPRNRFVLLRDKIDKLFDSDAIGLKDCKTKKVMKHCYIPLTERTIDPIYYYPCSIYIRGYGRPVGKISEPFEEQQKKIMKFIQNHDCRKDRICSRICTNCCKAFNVITNEKINRIKRIKVNKKISEKEISETDRKIRSLLSQRKNITQNPFIIIKPCGMNIKDKIMVFLKSKNIKIKYRKTLDNWHELANALYCYPLTKKEIIFTLETGKAFKKLEGNKVEVLYLQKISLDKLEKIKYELRSLFPNKRRLLIIGDKKRIIRSTVLHSPNKEDLKRELRILGNFPNCNGYKN